MRLSASPATALVRESETISLFYPPTAKSQKLEAISQLSVAKLLSLCHSKKSENEPEYIHHHCYI